MNSFTDDLVTCLNQLRPCDNTLFERGFKRSQILSFSIVKDTCIVRKINNYSLYWMLVIVLRRSGRYSQFFVILYVSRSSTLNSLCTRRNGTSRTRNLSGTATCEPWKRTVIWLRKVIIDDTLVISSLCGQSFRRAFWWPSVRYEVFAAQRNVWRLIFKRCRDVVLWNVFMPFEIL